MSNHSCKGSPCPGKFCQRKACGRENSRGKGGLRKKQAWLQEAGEKQWGESRIWYPVPPPVLCSSKNLKIFRQSGRKGKTSVNEGI